MFKGHTDCKRPKNRETIQKLICAFQNERQLKKSKTEALQKCKVGQRCCWYWERKVKAVWLSLHIKEKSHLCT